MPKSSTSDSQFETKASTRKSVSVENGSSEARNGVITRQHQGASWL
jgi:hypothetical protein